MAGVSDEGKVCICFRTNVYLEGECKVMKVAFVSTFATLYINIVVSLCFLQMKYILNIFNHLMRVLKT